ncbi:hypothetical protein [Brumicola pallidula]|uniref:Uncharacterized protein n=1 Tax=Brumicola pallidula DSM 14239 = ACAM 615 TaxID=1121922 RepID=K6ZE36_9ALTE|nr:hypothetical protein [Glaciecola pallidula]GAC28612.1 hypothetical protein GPAL_1749 [Glaciecola pallidula DSM 14239 = ACAM 615]
MKKAVLGLLGIFFLLSGKVTLAQNTVEELAEQFSTLSLYNSLFSLAAGNKEEKQTIINIVSILKHKSETLNRYAPPQLRETCNAYLDYKDIKKEALTWFIEGYVAGLDRAYLGDLKEVVQSDFSIFLNTVDDVCREDRAEFIGLAILKSYMRLIRQN